MESGEKCPAVFVYARSMDSKEVKTPNWELIEAEYISTAISQSKLAAKCGIPFRTLADRALAGKWVAKRKAYKQQVVQSTVKKLASSASAKDYAKLVRLQNAADRMAAHLEKATDDADQFRRHVVIVGDGMGASHAECNIYDKYDARAMKDMSAAIKDMTATLRNLYQLPTEAELEAQKLAREKLALEKQKAAQGKPGPDDDETGVVQIATVLPEASDE